MLKWAALIFALTMTTAAAEEAARCQIEVGGTSYLDAPCEFEVDTGTITIGVGDSQMARHFAYIIDGVAYWNGLEASSKADTLLGPVAQNGDCWLNADTRLCVAGAAVLDLMGN